MGHVGSIAKHIAKDESHIFEESCIGHVLHIWMHSLVFKMLRESFRSPEHQMVHQFEDGRGLSALQILFFQRLRETSFLQDPPDLVKIVLQLANMVVLGQSPDLLLI